MTECVIWAGDTLVPHEGPSFRVGVLGWPGQNMEVRGSGLTFGDRKSAEVGAVSGSLQ